MGEPVERTDGVGFERSIPILRVAELESRLRHYVDVLGFVVDWCEPGIMAQVSRGRAHLMLCEGDQGHTGGWVWLGVSDVDALHAELVAAGATIRMPPSDYPWAREMQVVDPDGNVLRLGAEPREGRPCADWTDMHGQRWTFSEEAGWRRPEPSVDAPRRGEPT